MMRCYLLITLSICTACASTDRAGTIDEQAPTGDLQISLSRAASGDRPILSVTITNTSSEAMCMHADLFNNLYSQIIGINLKDSRGREIRPRSIGGFIVPPPPGVTRVAPGGAVQGRYYLDSRFNLRFTSRRFPHGAKAQVFFRYGRCDNIGGLQAVSSWQPI
jgi:hypothetical protein